jgi:hypothetical protein
LLAVSPPLFTEKGKDTAAPSRRSVPWRELSDWLDDAKRQLDGQSESVSTLRPLGPLS